MGTKPGEVRAGAHLHLWSEVPMPRAPWAGWRKPGAGAQGLHPAPHIINAHHGLYMGEFTSNPFKGTRGPCTLLRTPTPDRHNLLYQGRQQNPTMELHLEGTTSKSPPATPVLSAGPQMTGTILNTG